MKFVSVYNTRSGTCNFAIIPFNKRSWVQRGFNSADQYSFDHEWQRCSDDATLNIDKVLKELSLKVNPLAMVAVKRKDYERKDYEISYLCKNERCLLNQSYEI